MDLRILRLASSLCLRRLGASRRILRTGPVSLVYYVLGPEEGEPWLLLHGLGSVALSWRPVIRALRGSCRLVVPELSALGGTECPGEGLGIAAAGEVLPELLEREFGSRPATVVGLSLGGWMAVRLALAQPARASRLALVDAGGYRNQDWDRIRSLVRVTDLAGVDRLYEAFFVHVPWLLRVFRRTFLKAYTSPAVRNVLAGLSEADTFDAADLRSLTMPTGLIWGERDGLFTVRTARAMAAALPNAHLEILPGCGHAVPLERPEALAAAVQRFREATSKEPDPRHTTGGRTWQAPNT